MTDYIIWTSPGVLALVILGVCMCRRHGKWLDVEMRWLIVQVMIFSISMHIVLTAWIVSEMS